MLNTPSFADNVDTEQLDYRLIAIEKASDGIAIVDKNGHVTYANGSLFNFYDIDKEQAAEIVGQPWEELILQGQSQETVRAIKLQLDDEGELYGEISFLLGEQEKAAELALTKLEDGGIIVTLRDVAQTQNIEREREALKEQLYQAQKLEAIGRLAGGIAHDFNNILAAMNGYAEFLIEDLNEESEQHEFAINILKAGHQARELVDKMLAFSRREDSKMQVMNLNESVREVLLMLKASLPKTIEVSSEFLPVPALINGNQTQMAQAVMNLCVNAKDAMAGDRGTLELSVSMMNKDDYPKLVRNDALPETGSLPLIKIEEEKDGAKTCLTMGSLSNKHDYISLKIADTGTGITRVIMEHIFEPFFTTKPVDKGTGLGLAMVHGLIAGHQGAMQIESELNKGTSFELFFPLASEAQQEEKIQQSKTKEYACPAKVLLVEDQDDVRDMTMNMLRRINIEAECCDSGMEALDILRENPGYFDVVVTDHNMPKMTGLELIMEAALDFPELPFIILSGYSEERMKTMAMRYATVKAILAKPVAKNVLYEAIESAYNNAQS